MKVSFFKIFTALAVICVAGSQVFAQAKKPNIIIILADDLGWGDVSFHGSEIRTPNIDGFARNGVILNRFYTAPICSPTRSGLITGRYPNRFGLRATVVPPWSNFGVDLSEKYLPEYLKEAGYQNRAAIGKWHLGHGKKAYLPLSRGFTHFYGHYNGAINYFTHKREGELDWHNDWETSFDKGYSTDLIADEAVKCINNYSKGGSPFFMYVAFNAPHGPLQAKEEDLLAYGYDKTKPKFAKGEAIDGDVGSEDGKGNTPRQTYSAMVSCLDRNVGRILAQLKQLHIEDNTIVLFFSDNGAAPKGGSSSGELRGNKFLEWEGGVRSTAVVRWPAVLKGGTQSNQLMGYVDIVPTLLGITGVKNVQHKPFDGIDLSPLFKQETEEIDRQLYLGYGSLINGKWKLVKANSGNNGMKATEDQLFDIVNDPTEKNNLKAANDAVYQQMLKAVAPFDAIKPERSVPPFGEGRQGFKAPKDWLIME